MKQIKLKWYSIFKFANENKSTNFNRKALVFPIERDGTLLKKQPKTIHDHFLKLFEFSFQKEGISIIENGNPYNLTFEDEIIYLS